MEAEAEFLKRYWKGKVEEVRYLGVVVDAAAADLLASSEEATTFVFFLQRGTITFVNKSLKKRE